MWLTLSVGLVLYVCSAMLRNLEISSWIGKSSCLSWVNLCLAIVTLPHTENLSCSWAFIGNQIMPLEANSLMYLSKVPLEVVKATSVDFLFEMMANLETSSSHVPNSFRSLPSHD